MNLGCSAGYIFAQYGADADFEGWIRGINRISEMGFSALSLEIFNGRQLDIFTPERRREIRRLYRRLGLSASQFVPEYASADLFSTNPEARKRGIATFSESVRMCAEMELGDVVEITSRVPAEIVARRENAYLNAPPTDLSVPEGLHYGEIWNCTVEMVAECLEIAKAAGLRVAIEPRAYTVISNTDTFLRLFDRIGDAALGMILDTSHLFVQREALPVAVEKLGDRLFGTHLCDTDGTLPYHWAPGSGRIDWANLFAALKKTGYSGPLDLELFGTGIEDVDAEYLKGKGFVEETANLTGKRT